MPDRHSWSYDFMFAGFKCVSRFVVQEQLGHYNAGWCSDLSNNAY